MTTLLATLSLPSVCFKLVRIRAAWSSAAGPLPECSEPPALARGHSDTSPSPVLGAEEPSPGRGCWDVQLFACIWCLSVALSLCLSACSLKALGTGGWSRCVGSLWLGAAEETFQAESSSDGLWVRAPLHLCPTAGELEENSWGRGLFQGSGPQAFPHRRRVSWRTVFRRGWGTGSRAQVVMRVKLWSLTCRLPFAVWPGS